MHFLLYFLIFITTNCHKKSIIINNTNKAVILAPNITDIFLSLNLEKHIIGVTRQCNFKSNIIGDYYKPDISKIVKINPKFIFTSNEVPLIIKSRLENFGFKIIDLKFKTINDLYFNTRKIANIFNVQKKALSLNKELSNKMLSTNNFKCLKYLFMLSSPTIFSVGTSWISDFLSKLGFCNIIKSKLSYPIIDTSTILNKNPDVIFITRKIQKEYLKNISYNGRVVLLKENFFFRISPQLTYAVDYFIKLKKEISENSFISRKIPK